MRMNKPRRMDFLSRSLPVVLATALGIAACGGGSTGGVSAAADSGEGAAPTAIRFTFDWVCVGDWAPALWADSLGYFEDEALAVEHVPGTGSSDALPLIGAGEQDMGQISGPPLVLGVPEGLPVTVVGVPMTESPVVIFADGSIKEPKDLEGKIVVTQGGQFEGAVWEAWAKEMGIDRSTIEEIPAPPESGEMFIGHRVDAFVQFYPGPSTVAFTTGRSGEETIFFVQEVLPNYGHSIVVNQRFLSEHPEAVRGFLRAWARGMKYTIDHPDESMDLVLDQCQELQGDREVIDHSISTYVDLWASSQAQEDGLLSFTAEGWESTKRLLVDGGLMEDTDISDLYTLEYLPDPPIYP